MRLPRYRTSPEVTSVNPGDRAKQRGFSGARWTDDDNEFAFLNDEADRAQDMDSVREGLRDLFQFQQGRRMLRRQSRR